VPIEFCDLLSDEGWAPFAVDVDDPHAHWLSGGTLADAPVDVAATFDGAMAVSTEVDASFNAVGYRCRPGFTLPRRQHNLRQLVIVFGGGVTVEWGDDGSEGRRSFRLGEFWVTEPGTAYALTAGDEGVVYVESWSEPLERLETWWHDHGWVHR
jgi:hypothetical protein